MSLLDLIGNNVYDCNGAKSSPTSYSGDGKVIGLYFSSSWCGPCLAFTPTLIQFYNAFKENNPQKGFEIIFISWDEDEDEFNKYKSDMPWLHLDFSADDIKAKLNKKLKVQTVPTLVLIDGQTGQNLSDDGRSIVLNDPEGKEYPWRPKPLSQVISGQLLKSNNETVDSSVLSGKVKGFYFSAHWCPPCKAFTPSLEQTYMKLKEEGKPFEVVFVSSDRSKASFEEYFATMPWLAIPFEDERSRRLGSMFGVDGIPSFVIVDEKDQVITKNGRLALTMDPEGLDYPWHPKPLNELNDYRAQQVNETPCLVLFTDGEEEDKVMARMALQEIADEFHCKKDDQELHVFYGGDDEFCDTLRDFVQLEDRNPLLVIIDIPEKKVFVSEAVEIDKHVVREFVDKYLKNELRSRSFNEAFNSVDF